MKQSQAFLRVAALTPSVRVASVATVPMEGRHTMVRVTVQNDGYLSTAGIPSAKALPFNEPLSVEFRSDTLAMVGGKSRHEVGHLDGWGRGQYGGSSLFFQRSRGNLGTRVIEQVVRGHGVLSVRVGSCRVGWVDATVEI